MKANPQSDNSPSNKNPRTGWRRKPAKHPDIDSPAAPFKKAMGLAARFPGAWLGGRLHRRDFDSVETFFLFLCAPKSGHSIVGSLLDAHPMAICAQEMGVLKYIMAGYPRESIYHLLTKNSRDFMDQGRIASGRYRMVAPGQHHGKYRVLKALGDKQGSGALHRLHARPWLLDKLRKTARTPVRFIHVVRHPLDNIVSIAELYCMPLSKAISYYFQLCDISKRVRQKLDDDEIIDIHHEDFIEAPGKELNRLCQFLGLETTPSFLEDCGSIVFKKPRHRRREVEWDDERLERIRDQKKDYRFLDRYEWDASR